jgi:Protein of unknown function (DUF2934)
MTDTVKTTSGKPKTAAKPRKTAAKKSGTNGTAAKVTEIRISHEQVASLAHQYWIERGHQHGFDEEDWFRAERELRSRAS